MQTLLLLLCVGLLALAPLADAQSITFNSPAETSFASVFKVPTTFADLFGSNAGSTAVAPAPIDMAKFFPSYDQYGECERASDRASGRASRRADGRADGRAGKSARSKRSAVCRQLDEQPNLRRLSAVSTICIRTISGAAGCKRARRSPLAAADSSPSIPLNRVV